MLPFWIISIVAWGLVVLYSTSGAWAMISGRGIRRGDPMRLACWLTGIVIVALGLRWIFAPDSIALWQALTILSAACALYILKLERTYGRGARV